MAEQSLPPSPNFNNINFNPAFFPNASSEFLNFPVAQGVETFSQIYATEIDTPTPTIDFDFLASETGNINIGTLVPATKTIKLGQATGTSVHVGSIDFTGTAINNNVSATTGDISLGNNQTTGALYIGANATTATRTTGAIYIGSNSTGAGTVPITIGTGGISTIALNGTNVSVGTKISSTTYDSTGTGTAMTLGGNLQAADVSIGGVQTSGGINIGASTGRTTAGTINIGTRSTVANPINIGSSTSLTSVGNTLAVAGLLTASAGVSIPSAQKIIANTYETNGTGTGNNMALGGNLLTGSITIGGIQTSGTLDIGTGPRLLSGLGGGINIGTGSGAVANPIIIGGASSVITLGAQPTIGYAVKASTATSSLAFIGGRYEVRIAIGSRTISTIRTAFCAMNNLPTGVYHITPYVFIPIGVATNVEVLLCTGVSAISEAQTTGLTPVADGSETFSSGSLTIPNSVNSSWVYVVSSPVNIALGIKSGTALSSTSAVYLKIIRIG